VGVQIPPPTPSLTSANVESALGEGSGWGPILLPDFYPLPRWFPPKMPFVIRNVRMSTTCSGTIRVASRKK
jgi:hypothetical protein